MTHTGFASIKTLAFLAALLLSVSAHGQEPDAQPGKWRWDLSLDLPIWPSLADLQPPTGSFDGFGYGLGMSAHTPVKQFQAGELMLGFDGSIAATPSNIRGSFDKLLARQLYLGVSAKLLFGPRKAMSLDAGIGYHEVDMAQVDSNWYGTLEYEHWSASSASSFIGATWDIGAGQAEHNSGLFVGLRVHFADFGSIYDKEFVPGQPALGPGAGTLDGPLYMLRIGYSGR